MWAFVLGAGKHLAGSWKLYALAAAVLVFGFQGCRIKSLKKDVAQAEAKVLIASSARDIALAGLKDAHNANVAGEAVIAAQRAELDARKAEADRNRAANDAALKAAKAAQKDAEVTLQAFVDRYARASRVPECKALLDTPLSVCGG